MTSLAPARVVSVEAEDAMIIARITEHGKLVGLIRQRNYKIAREKSARFPTIFWTTWNEKEETSGKGGGSMIWGILLFTLGCGTGFLIGAMMMVSRDEYDE